MHSRSSRRTRPPLEPDSLRELGLWYVGRYATSKAKLIRYLNRKIHERGWDGDEEPDLDRIAERFEELGFIDDRGFAASRATSLARRGYGARRVAQDLYAAGIAEADREEALAIAQAAEYESALKFARKRKIGPFARGEIDEKGRSKAIGAMLRAGHSYEIVREILGWTVEEIPERLRI